MSRTQEVAAAVEAARATTTRKALYMSTTGRLGKRWYLGKNGKWVSNRGHARRFNPAQAREFLAKRRPVTWNVD